MTEYIGKWSVVNMLIDIENEFQQYKPFHGFEHAMYRKICEAEIAIGKTQAVDAVPVVRCKDCKYFKTRLCENADNYDDWFCADGERKDEVANES